MKIRLLAGLACAGLSAVALAAQQAPLPAPSLPFDLVILNARVFDGTGNPWFPADIGVRDGRIAAVGSLARNVRSRREFFTGFNRLWADGPISHVRVGRAMMRAAEDEARARGCTTIVIFAHSFQPHQLYSRLGYEVVARIEDFPSGSDALWMVKRLESAD